MAPSPLPASPVLSVFQQTAGFVSSSPQISTAEGPSLPLVEDAAGTQANSALDIQKPRIGVLKCPPETMEAVFLKETLLTP